MKKEKAAQKRKYFIISAISLLTFLVIWEICSDVLRLLPAYALPSPVQVVKTFFDKLTNPNPDRATLLQHLGTSLQVALTGYLIGIVVGVPLGVLMGWYKRFDQFFKPIFDVIRPIPPIGWIPIMVVLFGIGLQAKSAVIFLASVVPCMINTYSGIKQTNPVHLWVAQTFGATNFQMLCKIAIPSALPMIFTGLKVALNAAWMALVAAELLAATKGIGYMIQISRMFGRADIIVVGMLTVGAVSLVFNWILDTLEKKLVKGGM